MSRDRKREKAFWSGENMTEAELDALIAERLPTMPKERNHRHPKKPKPYTIPVFRRNQRGKRLHYQTYEQ